MKYKISITSISLALILFFGISFTWAANFSVSPLLLDYNAEARDIINRDILLTNNTDKPIRAYASVHEIIMGEGTQIKEFVPGSMTQNRNSSITSWLEISRARLEIPPGGNITVPLTIRIHPEALPGVYHALVGFASGRNSDDIESQVIAGNGVSAILKITIDDKRKEQVQLVNFVTNRFVFSPENNTFTFTLENTGDMPVTPEGEVIIYDTSGKELAAVPANSERLSLAPGEQVKITENLPFIERLGRNKAYLSLEYGENRASVFDTTFYYSIPWYYLLGFVLILFSVFVAMLWAFKKAFSGSDFDSSEHIYEVPLFYRQSHDHDTYDHDLNLKDDEKPN